MKKNRTAPQEHRGGDIDDLIFAEEEYRVSTR